MSFWQMAAVAGAIALVSPVYAQSPLTLDDALRRADVSSVGVQIAGALNPRLAGPEAQVEAAKAGIAQARLRPNPQLSLELEDFGGSGAFDGVQQSEYTFSLGQRIELGGKRKARIGAAQAQVVVANLQTLRARADLALLVRQRYVAAVAAEARLMLAKEIVDRSRELARIAKALVDEGRERPLRALRANAALAEAEAEFTVAKTVSRAAKAGLIALWSGQDASVVLPARFPLIDPPETTPAVQQALDLQVAAREREAAQSVIARERSLAVPDPTISAGLRRFQQSRDNAFVVGVSIPLPFWNRNQGNIQAAKARFHQAEAQEAVALADVRQRLLQARADYEAAQGRVNAMSATSLPQAEEALRLVQIGYRAGHFPLIEVLSAAAARDDIRNTLIAARESRARSAALLIRLAAVPEGLIQ